MMLITLAIITMAVITYCSNSKNSSDSGGNYTGSRDNNNNIATANIPFYVK